jgi:pyrophosphatase PpaX
MMRAFDTYLFDLDGTLIDTAGLITECFKYSLHLACGEVPAEREIKKLIGLPLAEQFKRHLAGKTISHPIETLMKKHMDYQFQIASQYIRLFDGVKETLSALQERATLAVVTSRRQESAFLYCKQLGIYDFFSVFATPESTQKHKPDPEPAVWALSQLGKSPEGALMIGDSVFDLMCGAGAGTKTCYVSWASEPVETIAHQPDFLIHTMGDLLFGGIK